MASFTVKTSMYISILSQAVFVCGWGNILIPRSTTVLFWFLHLILLDNLLKNSHYLARVSKYLICTFY